MATEWQPQNPGSIIWIAAIPVLFPFYSKNFESFAKPNQCKLVALDILFMTTLSLLDWELLILEIKLDLVWVLNEWCLQGSHIVLWWSSGQITFESYLFSVNNMSECWQRFLLAMLGIHREHDETKSLHFCFKKTDWNEQDYKDFSEENHILWSIICLLTSWIFMFQNTVYHWQKSLGVAVGDFKNLFLFLPKKLKLA